MVFEIEFHNESKGQGGFEIGHDSNRLTFSNFAMTSALTSRYDHLDDKGSIQSLCREVSVKIQESTIWWIEHFECGAWLDCASISIEIHGSFGD